MSLFSMINMLDFAYSISTFLFFYFVVSSFYSVELFETTIFIGQNS